VGTHLRGKMTDDIGLDENQALIATMTEVVMPVGDLNERRRKGAESKLCIFAGGSSLVD
jgi:hypothetical protein